MDHLRQLQNIIQATSREIMWINDCEEEELLYDWSDRNTNIAQKQEAFSVSPREPPGVAWWRWTHSSSFNWPPVQPRWRDHEKPFLSEGFPVT